jgi:hypothetical protein
MTPEYILSILTKHGATGVLCVWLSVMHFRISDLERKLYDCYRDKFTTEQQHEKRKPIFAVLPEPIKAKRKRDC